MQGSGSGELGLVFQSIGKSNNLFLGHDVQVNGGRHNTVKGDGNSIAGRILDRCGQLVCNFLGIVFVHINLYHAVFLTGYGNGIRVCGPFHFIGFRLTGNGSDDGIILRGSSGLFLVHELNIAACVLEAGIGFSHGKGKAQHQTECEQQSSQFFHMGLLLFFNRDT